MELTRRQEEIILTSMRIITLEGITALTTKNISGQIGISEAALYRHFKNKDEILLSIMLLFEKKAFELLESACRPEFSDFENIYNILIRRCRDFVENPALVTVILSEEIFPQNSNLSGKIHDIMKVNHDKICFLIEEGQRKGEIRGDIPKEQFFNLMIGSFRFLVNQWRISQFGFNLEEKFIDIWEAFKKIIKN